MRKRYLLVQTWQKSSGIRQDIPNWGQAMDVLTVSIPCLPSFGEQWLGSASTVRGSNTSEYRLLENSGRESVALVLGSSLPVFYNEHLAGHCESRMLDKMGHLPDPAGLFSIHFSSLLLTQIGGHLCLLWELFSWANMTTLKQNALNMCSANILLLSWV